MTLVLTRLQTELPRALVTAYGYDTDEDTLGRAETPLALARRDVMMPAERVHNIRRLAYQDNRGVWCFDTGRPSLQRHRVPDELMAQIEKVLSGPPA